MKRMMTGMAWTALAALAVPAQASSQVAAASQVECAGGAARADLGISGFDCQGDCTLTLDARGRERFWSFSVEPRLTGVTPGSPADGILRAGDALVAIDGALITTAEGGRRYASLEPGQEVRVRFRRNGRLGEATLRAQAVCPPAPPPTPQAVPAPPVEAQIPSPRPIVGRLVPAVPIPDVLVEREAVRVAVAPRVVVEVPDSALRVAVDARVVVQVPDTSLVPRAQIEGQHVELTRVQVGVPEGRLGISFSCRPPCTGTLRGDVRIWEFSGPVEVIGVDPGGPADEAGIAMGDQITAVDGKRIDSAEGGEAFSRMSPGKPVELTVVRRSGREERLTVVPVTAETLERLELARPRVPPPARPARAPTERVPEPTRPGLDVQPPPPAPEPPEGLTLRYAGAVAGVEVEVRGRPVTVSELRGERVILIQSEGMWIRIRVPPGAGEPRLDPERR